MFWYSNKMKSGFFPRSVIESDRSCINGVSSELTQCERASVREFDESFQQLTLTGPVEWGENRRLLERSEYTEFS